jgi:hypothetical protein
MIIGTNFKLSSKKYLDNRQQCASLNDLIINKDSILYPQGFEVYCIKEKAWYQNVSEGDTPEWKIRQSGTSEGGASIDDTKISATTTWSSEYIYDMKLELQDLITQTEDYVAEIDDRLLYVEGRLTSIGSFDGSYDSLTNKPEFPSLQGYATHEYVDEVIANIGKIEGTKDYNELINQPINNVAIEYIIDERLIVNVDYLKVGKWYIVNTDLNEEYNSATSFSLVYYLSSDSYSIINTFENEDMHSLIYVSSEDEKEIKIKYITVNGETYELIYNKETNEKTLNLLSSSGNGNGGFSGDYNDLENKPCYELNLENVINYDGDYENKNIVYDNLVHVSDKIISVEEFIEGEISGTVEDGGVITYSVKDFLLTEIQLEPTIEALMENYFFTNETGSMLNVNYNIIIVYDDNFIDDFGVPIEKGIWFSDFHIIDPGGSYMSSLKYFTYEFKQLDEKFIPDTIARIEDVNILIKENGLSGDYNDLENRPCYGDVPAVEVIEKTITDFSYENRDVVEIGALYAGWNNDLETRVFVNICQDFNEDDMKGLLNNGVFIDNTYFGELYECSFVIDSEGYGNVQLYDKGCYFYMPYSSTIDFILVTEDNYIFGDGTPLSRGIWLNYVYYGGLDYIDEFVKPDGAYITFKYTTKSVNNDSFKQLDEKYIPDSVKDYNNLSNVPCIDSRKIELEKFDIESICNKGIGDSIAEEFAIYDKIEIADGISIFKINDEPLFTYDDFLYCYLHRIDFDDNYIIIGRSINGITQKYDLDYMSSYYINNECYDPNKFLFIQDGLLIVFEDDTSILLETGNTITLSKGSYGVMDENNNTSHGKCTSAWCEIEFCHYVGEFKELDEKFIRSHLDGIYDSMVGAYYRRNNEIFGEVFNSYEESYNRAAGKYSHAEGFNTKTSSFAQHVQGKYNIEDTENKYSHIVGNGVSSSKRSNAHTLDWNGNAWYQGNVSIDGTPTDDNHLVTKKYIDESIGGIIKELPIYEFNANGTIAYINLTDLEFNETYTLNTEKYPDVSTIHIRRYFEDGTFKLIRNFSGVNVKSIFRLANPQLEGVDVALCSTSIYSTFQFYIKLGTSKDDCTVEWSPCYLSFNNTHKYEQTKDYNPATKKYVDDLVSNIDLNDYITDTELEGKGYITEIPSEYITDTELEEKGYITDTELEKEMIFETDNLTVNSLGGISANTDLNGLTVKEILNKLLYPYIEPVITVTATPNGGTYEKGNNQTITNVSVSITKKSEMITKIEVLNGTQVIARQNDEAINNGGTFNYNVNVNVPSTNKQLTVKVTDNSGNAITKTTNTFTFVYPYYYGVCDEGTTINGDLIKSLTKSVEIKGTKAITYTTNNQRMIFAYPKSYGVITKILDPNSFDVTSTFTMSQITIIGLDGTGQSYYVYVNNPSTVSNFNMKFSY